MRDTDVLNMRSEVIRKQTVEIQVSEHFTPERDVDYVEFVLVVVNAINGRAARKTITMHSSNFTQPY